MRGLLVVEAAGAAASSASTSVLNGAMDWWHDVNESPLWQDRIFHVLAMLYGIVSAVALIQLIRIECESSAGCQSMGALVENPEGVPFPKLPREWRGSISCGGRWRRRLGHGIQVPEFEVDCCLQRQCVRAREPKGQRQAVWPMLAWILGAHGKEFLDDLFKEIHTSGKLRG